MKNGKKTLAALLACVIAVSCAACSGSDQKPTGTAPSSGGDAEVSKDPITFTIWNTEVVNPGVQSNDVANKIQELTGVTMDIVQGDAQKFSILVAGGDLPEIIYSNPAQQNVTANTLINGGHVIALDDLIGQHGPNIKKYFPARLEYSKQFLSNNQNQTYFLPVLGYQGDKENPDTSFYIQNIGLMTRWDVYAAVGYPEIKTTDDYLAALKQMQDYAREKDLAAGKQIYAISGWSDWGLWPWWLANAKESGYDDLPNVAVINRETEEVDMLYNTDVFWDGLKFYNKAYNMGIVDPEAFTMKNDQFWEKCNNGQVLMAYASWQTEYINDTFEATGHPDWTFEKIPVGGYPYVPGIVTSDAPIGTGSEYANAITSNCKDPARALQFLDFFNSEEGARLCYSGVEGVQWETKDGVSQPTAAFLEMQKTDRDYRTKTGTGIYAKMCGFSGAQMLSDKYPADLSLSNEQKSLKVSSGERAYCEYWEKKLGGSYEYPGKVLEDLWKKGEVKTITDYELFPSLIQSPSDQTLSTISEADQYMNVQGVKAVMAKSDAEFDACRQEAMAELQKKGYDKVTEEMKGLYAEAKKSAENFKY